MDKFERMKWLVEEINKHNKNYYVYDNPTISDAEYDALYYELVDLEKELNLTEILENTFGKPSRDKIPKSFEKSVERLNNEISTTISYRQRFEEIDAFETGKRIKDLICYK